jgi:hypothetical protein
MSFQFWFVKSHIWISTGSNVHSDYAEEDVQGNSATGWEVGFGDSDWGNSGESVAGIL